MKKGFDRLRGAVIAGAMGVAGLGGGVTARAATTGLGLNVTRGNVVWTHIDNNSSFPSSSDVTTTNGATYTTDSVTAFGIADATFSNGSSTFSDAFDNALLLSVDGNLFVNPTGTVDLTGDTLTSDTVTDIVAGIDAQIQYWFSPTRPVVRAVFSLTNTTGAPITIDPAVLGDYGSDSDTEVVGTSSGDTTIDNTDLWYITDDGEGDGDPRIMTSRYGEGAAVVPTNALTPGIAGSTQATFGLRYHTTVPAGATVRIMVFMELSDPDNALIANANAAAADYTNLDTLRAAGLLTGLSQTDIDEIINYAPTSSVPVPFGPLGLFSLFGLLGGAGFFQMRRRKK